MIPTRPWDALMTDFTLEPDELEPPRPAQRRPVRLVSTGLHPLEAVPPTRGTERDPAYAPCAACGRPVLVGETRAGTRLALEVHVPTYCVLWGSGEALPVLEPSRGYPVHGCVGGVGTATP